MQRTRRAVGLLYACVLTLALGAGGDALADRGRESLLVPAERPPKAAPVPAAAVQSRYVRVDLSRLGEETRLDLFPEVRIDARHLRTEVTGPKGSVWIGRVLGQEGRVFLSTVDGVTVGQVRLRKALYDIRYVGDGINAVYRIDTSTLPNEGCDAGPPLVTERSAGDAAPVSPSAETAVPKSDPCNVIDMLVLYTPAAKNAAGGAAPIEAEIHLAISVTNMTFEDSAITTRISPVFIDEIDYVEAATGDPDGDAFDDRNALRDPADGVMDEAHELRDRYCADVVHLITEIGGNGTNSWCGAAYVMDPAPDATHEAKGFAVTVRDCASTNFTFAHETGHLFGARHDWYVDDEPTPYVYAHGYINRAEGWRTVMAYNNECNDAFTSCERIGLWSSPNEFYMGDPAGIAEGTDSSCVEDSLSNPDCDAENWRVINATDCTVANFRDRSQCIESAARNVWMKDTWFDTGLEPDPWTAGQDMWKSPYIWVRNKYDATGAYQHVHQNPEQGQTNYAYVKLHNDFDQAASGQLKLYWAQPSTGLVWPDDWTLFADNTVNIGAHATLLYPSSWDPPATGPFSLLARWSTPNNPSDPLATPEGASVSNNARNNNNIVVRSVDVVNLKPNISVPLPPMGVKATSPDSTELDLLVELPDNDHNFLRSGGAILLDLGGLHDNWVAGGAKADGARPMTHPMYGDVLEILDASSGVVKIQGIQIGRGEQEAVNFVLTAPYVPPPPPFPPISDDPPEETRPPTGDRWPVPTIPVNKFGLDIVQLEGAERVGGVGYEITVEATGGSGAVPDGHTVPGTPLRLSRDTTGDIVLEWSPSCSGTDADYAVYEGALGNFAEHKPAQCSTGGATSATLPLSTGDSYYLVVPTDELTEGSFGRDGNGVERPAGPAPCRPHAVVSCM